MSARPNTAEVAAAAPPRSSLGGPAKAALWLLSVDQEVAVGVINELEEHDIRSLAQAVGELGQTTQDELQAVHAEFQRMFDRHPLYLRGSTDYLGRLASQALGESRAALLLADGGTTARIGDPADGSAALGRADADILAPLLRQEHPQVIAAVLASLEPERSGLLLNRLPDTLRLEIVSRIARLKRIPRAALAQAERVLAAGLPLSPDDDKEMDGIRVAATLLNCIDPEEAEAILTSIEGQDDETATDIRQAMFTFDDLTSLDQRGMQALLKEVPTDQLLLTLKTASEELKAKVFASVSKRAADMFRDDLEVMAPVRVADVEKAQQAVVAVALQMQADGKLAISGRPGDEFV